MYNFRLRLEHSRPLWHLDGTILQVYGSRRHHADATAIDGIHGPPLHGHDINLLPTRVLSQVDAAPLRLPLRIDVYLLNLDQSAHLLFVDVRERGVVGGRRLVLVKAVRRVAAVHDQHFISQKPSLMLVLPERSSHIVVRTGPRRLQRSERHLVVQDGRIEITDPLYF